MNPFSNYMLFAGVIGSAMPDVPDVLVGLFRLNWELLINLNKFNSFFHAGHDGFRVDVSMQLVIFAVALYIIKSKRDVNET